MLGMFIAVLTGLSHTEFPALLIDHSVIQITMIY